MECNYYIYVDGSYKKVLKDEYESFEGRKYRGPSPWLKSFPTGHNVLCDMIGLPERKV